MPAAEGLLTALERNWGMVDGALAGLDDATLARSPSEQCNSIAWLLWHMTRVLDTYSPSGRELEFIGWWQVASHSSGPSKGAWRGKRLLSAVQDSSIRRFTKS